MDDSDLTIRVVGEILQNVEDGSSLATFTIWSRAEQYAKMIAEEYFRVVVTDGFCSYFLYKDGTVINF